MKQKLAIAITTGDHRGIGPEIIAKGISQLKVSEEKFVVFGVPELYKKYRKLLPKKWKLWTEEEVFFSPWKGPKPGHLNFIVPDTSGIEISKKAAFLSGRYIELATVGALKGLFKGLCTGPIDKNELKRGGFPFDGHTEMLEHICKTSGVAASRMTSSGVTGVTMMLAGRKMRVSLVTTHVPLKLVSSTLSVEKIVRTASNTINGLRNVYGIKSPRIAVLGLNPHAGDLGLFGDEEVKIIEPAIDALRQNNPKLRIDGPFPPDGFFAQWKKQYYKKYDAIVCMYHDQGLIPIKLLDFETTVNITLGLPIVRTSVDHGIGLDIAGKGIADPSSFKAALRLAFKLSKACLSKENVNV